MQEFQHSSVTADRFNIAVTYFGGQRKLKERANFVRTRSGPRELIDELKSSEAIFVGLSLQLVEYLLDSLVYRDIGRMDGHRGFAGSGSLDTCWMDGRTRESTRGRCGVDAVGRYLPAKGRR